MRKTILALALLLVLTGILAWSPWLTEKTASRIAENQFNAAWAGIIDGCGTFGDDYGAKEYRKIPFGAIVTLDYQCGLIAPNEPPLHATVYVTFVGTTFGYPRP